MGLHTLDASQLLRRLRDRGGAACGFTGEGLSDSCQLVERLTAKQWAARQAEAAASGPSRRGRNKAAANPDPSPVDAAPVTPAQLASLLR